MRFTKIYTRKSAEKIAVWLLSAAMLTGCIPKNTQPEPDDASLLPATVETTVKTDALLRVGMASADTTGNPYLLSTYKTQAMLDLVYETILTLDAQGNPQPGLCESWQVLNDGSVQLFVRKNVTFHDGTPLSAQHIVDSLAYIRDEAPDGACGGVMNYVRSFRVSPEGDSVILMPRRGVYPMLCALTVPVAIGELMQYGTGPYQIDQFQAGVGMSFSRYDGWWRMPPSIQNIEAVAFDEDDDQLRALAMGQIDLAYTRELGVSAYKATAGFTVLSVQSNVFDFLSLNMREDAPLNDSVLRQAVSLAINNKDLIGTVYQNNAIASELPMTTAHWLYPEELQENKNDLQSARAMLSQAGYTDHDGDGLIDIPAPLPEPSAEPVTENEPAVNSEPDDLWTPLTLRILVASDSADTLHQDTAEKVAETLKNIGLDSQIVAVSSARVSQRLKNGEFDLAVLSADMGNLPDLALLFDAEGTLNFSGYQSSEMQDLLQDARQALEAAELKKAYQNISTLALKDLPIIGIGMRCSTVLYNSALKGMGSVHATNLFANIDDWHMIED